MAFRRTRTRSALPAPGTKPATKEASATETGNLLGTGQGSAGVGKRKIQSSWRGSGDRSRSQSTQGPPRGRGGAMAPKGSAGQLCNKGLWELLRARSGPASPAALSPGLSLPGIDFPACLLVVIKGCVPGVLFRRDWNLESRSN